MFALPILIHQSIGTALPQTPRAVAELSVATGFSIIRPVIEAFIANYFFFGFEDQRDGAFIDPPRFTNTIRVLVNACTLYCKTYAGMLYREIILCS